MHASRVVAVAIAAAALSLALFPAFLALRAMGSKVFEPEIFDYVLLFGSVLAIAAGAQVVSFRGAGRIALFALLASGALLFGFFAAFSIGLAFLPAGLVFLLLLYRALRRTPTSVVATRAALGGAAIGFGLPLLFIALIVPATVECFANGGGTSSGRWRGSGHQMLSSSGIGGSPNGVITGRIDYVDSVVTFRCEQGRVVEFTRTPR